MGSMKDLVKRDIMRAKAMAAQEEDDSERIKAKNQLKILQVHNAEIPVQEGGGRRGGGRGERGEGKGEWGEGSGGEGSGERGGGGRLGSDLFSSSTRHRSHVV